MSFDRNLKVKASNLEKVPVLKIEFLGQNNPVNREAENLEGVTACMEVEGSGIGRK